MRAPRLRRGCGHRACRLRERGRSGDPGAAGCHQRGRAAGPGAAPGVRRGGAAAQPRTRRGTKAGYLVLCFFHLFVCLCFQFPCLWWLQPQLSHTELQCLLLLRRHRCVAVGYGLCPGRARCRRRRCPASPVEGRVPSLEVAAPLVLLRGLVWFLCFFFVYRRTWGCGIWLVL